MLCSNCTAEAKSDYETAIEQLLGNYNTATHENRFMVGRAVECFTLVLLRSAGIECKLAEKGGIIVQKRLNEQGSPNRPSGFLNISGSFSGKIVDLNLINTQGDSTSEWNTATLFVVSQVGIVFATPDTGDLKKHIRRRKDAVVLSKTGLKYLIESHSDLVFAMNISVKPEKFPQTLRPSEKVARDILSGWSLGRYLD